MPLSPREERILAAIQDGLGAQDPRLAAALAHPGRQRHVRAPLGLPQTAALVAALVVLVVVHAAGVAQNVWGTAVLTLALLVPWTVWATRRAGRDLEPIRPDGGNPIVIRIIILILLVWVALSVVGALIEGLFWLTVVGVVLFLATAAYGAIRRRSRAPRV